MLGLLGEGGMGRVYRARHLPLHRLVALKVLSPRVDLDRFRAEVQAIARMQHPNIVQIFEMGTVDQTPFYSMELVEGGTLAGRIAGNSCSTQESARLTETIARAVQHAHDHGIIHRDLKPSNILMTPEGEPKIGDFGLARQLDDGNPRSATNREVAGTPSYIAPEQLAQDPASSRSVDIYALGVILYELLTGRPPFRASTPVDTLWQARHCEPVPPGKLHPKLARDLETICLKCLRKEPRHRYSSALDLADDLARFQAKEPIHARPVPRWERCVKWAVRRPTHAASWLGLLVGLAAIIVAGWWISFREHQHVLELSKERDEANRAVAVKENTLLQLRESQSRTLRLADTLYNLTVTAKIPQEALQDLVKVYRDFVEYGRNLDDPQAARYRARGFGHLSDLYQAQGRPALALEQVEQAVAILQQLSTRSPDDRGLRLELAYALDRRGRSLHLNSRILLAEQSYRDSYAILLSLLEAEPRNDRYHSSAGGVLHNLANLLFKHGSSTRVKEAQGYIKQAVEAQEKALQIQDRTKYRAMLRQHLFLSVDGYRLEHNHTRLAATLDRLTSEQGLSNQDLQDCAVDYVRCADFARADSSLPSLEQERVARAYTEHGQRLRDELKRRKPIQNVK